MTESGPSTAVERMERSHLESRIPSIMTRDGLLHRLLLRMVVYKIVASEEWAEAEAAGAFMGGRVDRADGFIHFSTAEQALDTAAKWFAGRGDLTLAAVDTEALGNHLRWEPSRGGALFPHLYAALPMSAVVWSRPLPLGSDGRHVFGSLEA